MKTIIAGSRNFNNIAVLRYNLKNYAEDISEVVSGCAKGADTLGKQWAEEQGIKVSLFPAKWKDLSNSDAVIRDKGFGPYDALAGHRRNQEMAEYADALVAFWDGKSTGTKDMINRMKKLNKTVRILYV